MPLYYRKPNQKIKLEITLSKPNHINPINCNPKSSFPHFVAVSSSLTISLSLSFAAETNNHIPPSITSYHPIDLTVSSFPHLVSTSILFTISLYLSVAAETKNPNPPSNRTHCRIDLTVFFFSDMRVWCGLGRGGRVVCGCGLRGWAICG